MKILVISQYFYPENFRINDIVTELVKRGHIVTVLTGLPNYPEGEIYPGYEKAYCDVSFYNGAKVYRCKLRPRHEGTKNLALNYISFVKEASKKLKSIKPDFDIIYFFEPSPITSGIPAVKYGRKHKIKTVIYNLDIWPDCVRDNRDGSVMSKHNPVYFMAKLLSKYVYKRFDIIINKCDEFGDYLEKELGISSKKMKTIFEFAESNYLSVNEKPIDNGIVDFMFLGNIGKSQNCDQMVKAFSLIDNANTKLHFVGDGSYLGDLKKLVKNLNMESRVIFHGRHPLNEVVDFYNLADVCLLALSNKTASGLTPPAKLPGYMAACRPVIASINGASKSIIEESNCGFVCPADDIDSLSKLIKKIIDNKDKINELGSNGRRYFLEHFTLEKHIDQLERQFQLIIGGNCESLSN